MAVKYLTVSKHGQNYHIYMYIYIYIEHKKNHDIFIGIFFNTVATSMLPKISALIAMHGRPVYLYLT